jgi:uncharacterized protein (TIGR02186 family)
VLLLSFLYYNSDIHSLPKQDTITNPGVIPETIKVGPFFNGLKAIVTAELPKCSGVIVKFIGKDEEMILNEKGKKAFIWLNIGQVIVKNAPSIYILTSTDKLNEICSDADQKKELLGYNSLKERIVFESTLKMSENEFDEYIKLKEYKGCYNINHEAVIFSDSDGKQTLKATLEVPSFITPDEYNVVIYCFYEGNLVDKVVLNLSVEEVGIPLFIKNLAMNSPAIYGISSIIVAMIAGIIIGLIFTKKRNRK